MSCQKCNSDNIISVTGKTSDLVNIQHTNGIEISGYIPENLGIGSGDYLRFRVCLDCGQIQGVWPVTLEDDESED